MTNGEIGARQRTISLPAQAMQRDSDEQQEEIQRTAAPITDGAEGRKGPNVKPSLAWHGQRFAMGQSSNRKPHESHAQSVRDDEKVLCRR